MIIKRACRTDLKTILELQYLAYQSEAALLGDFSIPPLRQTHEEIQQEYQKGIFLKAIDDDGVIIGSVRAYKKRGTVFIGKLIVHPQKQRQGVGTKLLSAIEKEYPSERYELFTSDKSVKNIKLYERLGYARFREGKVSDNLNFIYLEKYAALQL